MKENTPIERKPWSENDRNFLLENLEKTPIEEIAKKLARTPRAIKLYLHFQRIWLLQDDKRNLLIELLTKKFVHPENFKTTRTFFQAVKIRQRRFWQLYRGEVTMKEKEYQALVDYFKVDLEDAFQVRQLKFDFLDDKKVKYVRE